MGNVRKRMPLHPTIDLIVSMALARIIPVRNLVSLIVNLHNIRASNGVHTDTHTPTHSTKLTKSARLVLHVDIYTIHTLFHSIISAPITISIFDTVRVAILS